MLAAVGFELDRDLAEARPLVRLRGRRQREAEAVIREAHGWRPLARAELFDAARGFHFLAQGLGFQGEQLVGLGEEHEAAGVALGPGGVDPQTHQFHGVGCRGLREHLRGDHASFAHLVPLP